MTCDNNRPCQRCVNKGLADTCEDAPRKRKKYLADVPPNVLLHKASSPEPPFIPTQFQQSSSMPGNPQPYELPKLARSVTQPIIKTETSDNLGFYNDPFGFQPSPRPQAFVPKPQTPQYQAPANNSPRPIQGLDLNGKNGDANGDGRRRTNFLSMAADLEYLTLSNILQDNLMHPHPSSAEETPSSMNLLPALSPHNQAVPNQLQPPPKPDIIRYRPDNNYQTHPECDESINQYFLGNTGSASSTLFPDVIEAIERMKQSDPAVLHERNSKLTISFTIGIVPDDTYHGDITDEGSLHFKEPEEIYAKVIKPFSYTMGYHSLIAYLRKRFPKKLLVKMAESMAAYRPSFIACTNSLKEGDLIFMEQCFQRTLLTYDNFIKVSGTPTIVWRRTGEIAYVGNEFCVLTGWAKEELIGNNRKFIVELLDDKSVVEYFQLFLRIAFGDFLGATMTECSLITPKEGVKIRTGCIWTLKRDVFGIPMMIIGNFLPIV